MRTFILARIWMVLCLLPMGGVRAEEFSWKSFLGQSTLALETGMAGLAKCRSATYSREFPVSLDVIYNADDFYNVLTKERSVVIDVDAPVVAINVNQIGILRCRMNGARVGVLAHSIGGEVFRIEVMYGDCDDTMRCVRREWNRTSVDDVIYDAVKTQIVDAHSDEFIARHYENLQSKHMRSLYEGLRCYSDTFSVGQIPTSEFRCMVAATVEGGVLSGVSLVELRNAGFLGIGTSTAGFFAAQQTYVDIDADARAAQAVIDTARPVIERTQAAMRAKMEEDRVARQRLDNAITAVQ